MKKSMIILFCILTSINLLFAPTIQDTKYERPNEVQQRFLEFYKQKQDELRKEQIDLFLQKLGKLESNNNWEIYNPYGYMGEWQLGEMALKTIGYTNISFKKFKSNPNIFPPELQKEAVIKLIEYNEKYINTYFSHYIGKTINGVKITKAGLLAAAHLGGNGSVKKFLSSNGKINKKDAYNTSIKDYLQKFSEINIT